MNPAPSPAPFKSAHLRATIVKILLIAGAITTGLSLLAEALTLVFSPITSEQEVGDNPIGTLLALSVFLIALLDALIYLMTAVFFLVWLYRVYDNLRSFSPWSRLDYSPGWAVGSFFIPFVNLVVPYRAIKEVWRKSKPPDQLVLGLPHPPAWFPTWWLFWLLSSFANNISLRLSFDEHIPDSTATIVSIVASGLSILAAVFAYLVVNAIDKRQEETSAQLGLGKLSGPPPPPNLAPDAVAPTPWSQ